MFYYFNAEMKFKNNPYGMKFPLTYGLELTGASTSVDFVNGTSFTFKKTGLFQIRVIGGSNSQISGSPVTLITYNGEQRVRLVLTGVKDINLNGKTAAYIVGFANSGETIILKHDTSYTATYSGSFSFTNDSTITEDNYFIETPSLGSLSYLFDCMDATQYSRDQYGVYYCDITNGFKGKLNYDGVFWIRVIGDGFSRGNSPYLAMYINDKKVSSNNLDGLDTSITNKTATDFIGYGKKNDIVTVKADEDKNSTITGNIYLAHVSSNEESAFIKTSS